MTISDRGVITLAYGKLKYIEMAKTLARSLKLHSPHISLAIVTDYQNDQELIELFDIVIPLNKDYGSNVRQKLHLNNYSPYNKTIFIDSDCIVVRDIQFIFEALKGISFTVPGEKFLSFGDGDEDNLCDLNRVLSYFSLERLPKFNGGMYYFEKGDIAKAVFETAQVILPDWKQLGFYEFQGDGPGDEPIIAVAMMLHNQNMYQDNGSMMRTPIGICGSLKVDVLTGISNFKKGSKEVAPAIVHFAGKWSKHYVYYREASKLKYLITTNFHKPKPQIFAKIQYNYSPQIAWSRYFVEKLLNIAQKFINKFS
ncbi:hypothetical protein H6G04_30805 [Calothrix membranacea FACHB-236]|nr:hypothetical protein [Calothrix membranacea FACHB-236]